MKKAYLQFWEISEIDKEIRNDGVTIHLTMSDYKNYIDYFYKNRLNKKVPKKYTRIVGGPIVVELKKQICSLVKKKLSIKIENYNFNNLLKLEDIILS